MDLVVADAIGQAGGFYLVGAFDADVLEELVLAKARIDMKAIVLSCNKYHPLTDHMIQSYQEIWPSHPFVFRVPYQTYPDDLKVKYGEKIELVRTLPGIKQTVLQLIEDIDDEEWVYWSIDDKYLVEINEIAANNCFDFVSNINDPIICGVMFCRCRNLLDPENLMLSSTYLTSFGEKYFQRKNYYQFWIPQFLRAKILRELFLEFPDRLFSAKEMDVFTGQEPDLMVKEFKEHQKMYVSEENFARFGESTCAGKITNNCHKSMIDRGIPTSGFKTSPLSILIGEM